MTGGLHHELSVAVICALEGLHSFRKHIDLRGDVKACGQPRIEPLALFDDGYILRLGDPVSMLEVVLFIKAQVFDLVFQKQLKLVLNCERESLLEPLLIEFEAVLHFLSDWH